MHLVGRLNPFVDKQAVQLFAFGFVVADSSLGGNTQAGEIRSQGDLHE